MAEKVEIPEEELQEVNERKISWANLPRVDSLNLEADRLSFTPSYNSKVNWSTTMMLAFQSIGIVYGDIGTSPLYVYASTFTDGIHNTDDVIGVLSLIIYTIVLVPFVKYVFIVLWANDNGDGGTFALYSLICRYARVGLIPNHQPEDRELSNYRLDTPSNQLKRGYKIKQKLENSKIAQILLFLVTILGTSMVIGDGVLTPSISAIMCYFSSQKLGNSISMTLNNIKSTNKQKEYGLEKDSEFKLVFPSAVLSAVGGIGSLGKDAVVWVSIAILVSLFSVQSFGTDKVGYSFAPIICLWFSIISGIGLYNLFKYDLGVLRAFNPVYIIDYFRRNRKQGWISLGGVVLCITGTEAMFADLGHFNVCAIQISFSGIVLPALVTAYTGQAAYLMKHPENVLNTFYDSIPDPIYWPTFVVAVAAAIIASQAMISGAFSIVSQSLSLGCFPRVKVVHTSPKYEGQVYIPEVNYILMVACVLVTYGFKTTENIGHAYGIAVVAVMVITTCMVALIMLVIWKTNLWWITLFFLVFISVETIYFSSVLYKFTQGGYLPLTFSLVLMIIMGIWHYVHVRRYMFELNNKVSNEFIRDLAKNTSVNRLPGMGLLYSELVQGIPPMFSHFVHNIPSIHSVVVIVSIKTIPISRVAIEERFLFRQVEPKLLRIYRCVVRYGYKDAIAEPDVFERELVEYLKGFILHEHFMMDGGAAELENINHSNVNLNKPSSSAIHIEESMSSGSIQSFNAVRSTNSSSRMMNKPSLAAEEEMICVQRAMEKGVVYLIGEAEVVAEQNSSFFKRVIVNYAYNFLRKNFRQAEKVLAIPRTRLLRIGMTYEI